MRTVLVLVVLALALPLVAAQQPPGAGGGGATPCDPFGGGGGFGGGFGGGGGPRNGTPRGGDGGPSTESSNGTRPDRNGTLGPGGGRGGQNGIAELNVTFQPSGRVTIEAGQTATVVATLLNAGGSTLHVNLSVGGRPNANATPPPQNVSATLDPTSIAIGPGSSATATLTVRVDAATPPGCVGNVGFFAREVGTNRTSVARIVVDVPAPSSATPQGDAPAIATAATSPSAGGLTAQAQKTTPGASLAFALAMVVAAALHKRR